MDTRIIKAIVALAAISFNTYLFSLGRWGWGITLLFLTAVLIVVVFRSTRLIIVFYHMRSQKMDKAKLWLGRINPDHLWAKQKGYYFFLLGSVDIQTNSLSQSEKNFKSALQHGLRLEHDKAAAYLNLAVISANRRKKREAILLLNEAKKYDSKGYLKNDIKQVSKMVTSM